MSDKFTIYILSGTHWDREWYQTFQGFRYRLVETLNQALDDLEAHPEFPVFTLDGQTIVLEDYLEIEPGREAELRRLIAEGRLLIGPWYVMPDEFLLSGESLIHNLLLGRRICKSYGVAPWNYGYICDIFGHAAQTPQIFAGFGIDAALLGRGTNEHTTPAHFRWRSPDGTDCLTFKLADDVGYGDYTANVWFQLREDSTDEEIDARIRAEVDKERARSDQPVVLLMDALDHMPLRAGLAGHMERMRRLYPDAEVRLVSLERMVEQLRPLREQLPVKCGELNEPAKRLCGYIHLITNVLSSRYDLKQSNDRAQTLLEKWIEPLTVLTARYGSKRIQKTYADVAYRHLIQNHPHDSICGCSIDQVHRDMRYRFDQVHEIGKEVMDYGFAYLSGHADADPSSDTRALRLFNPLPYARTETVTVDLFFHTGYPYRYSEPFGYEDRNSFRLIDSEGREVPYKLTKVVRGITNPTRADNGPYDQHTVSFSAWLAPGGFTEYRIEPSDTPVRYFDTLRTGAAKAENALVQLTVQPDGTLRLLDKRNGHVYENLLQFADDGEIGDGWYHANPTCDRTVLSCGAPCTVEVVEDGPARCTFRIAKQMQVPAYLERVDHKYAGLHRSCQTATLRMVSDVSLDRGDAMVRVETTVENTARDHRLRLLLPTGLAGGRYFASEAFCVVERDCGVRRETETWREAEPVEKAMSSFAGKRGADGAGLAFVSACGLHEVAGLDDAEGTLAVTMLRAFATTVDGTRAVDGQLPGVWQYRYALLPLDGRESYGCIQRRQDALAAGFKAESERVRPAFQPARRSFITLRGDDALCFSTCKLPEEEGDAAIVRLYNLSDQPVSGVLTIEGGVRGAAYTDLAERELAPILCAGAEVPVTAGPWKIVTVRIDFDRRDSVL